MRAPALLLISLLVVCACRSSRPDQAPQFTYDGDTGPAHWGDLSPDWVLARTGTKQSPVDIAGSLPGSAPLLEAEYHSAPLRIKNTGHTVFVDYAPGSSVMVSGAKFELKRFQFRTPSEHTVAGRRFPMEVQLVHDTLDGDIGILSILFEEGAENAFLASFWDHLPESPGPTQEHADVRIDVRGLLPPPGPDFRYSGSLTEPPCTEGVAWVVLEQTVQASAEQIEAFTAIIGNNSRPVQPLNGRMILRIE